MTQMNRDVMVAQQPGTRLLLAGGPRMSTAFEGPSERTLFFQKSTAEDELRRLSIPPASVELRAAKLSLSIA